HGIAATWETRERVVVALTGGPEGDTLIRRAARITARVGGGELLAVHVVRSDGLSGSSVAVLERQRSLLESLGGSYHSVLGDGVAEAVLGFARASNATQIVIGASRRNPVVAGLTGPGTGMTITRLSGSIDVHVVGHDFVGKGRVLPRLSGGLTVRRRLTGLLVGGVLLAVLVLIGTATRSQLSLGSDLLLFLLAVVVTSLIGGFYPAFVAAVAASVLVNYFLVPPVHRLTISAPENVLALVVFVSTASLVSRVVDRAARRTSEAARANAEAETLSTLAGSLLRGEQALPALMARIQETFAVSSVCLLRRETAAPASVNPAGRANGSSSLRGTWSSIASVGDNPCQRPDEGDTDIPIGDDLALVLRGRKLAAEDQRMLAAFATEVAVAYRQRQLSAAAEAADKYAETDRTRTALLNAVSHDLRTPLASAKIAISSLVADDVSWNEEDRHELLLNANSALDRLTGLVTNLLDLSRIQAGVLTVNNQAVGLEDVLSNAVAGTRGASIEIDVSPDLPEVLADAGLLERVIANVVENALRYSPPDKAVLATATSLGGQVELRIIDQGPGIPAAAREAVFEAFQRRDDGSVSTGAGVGLGLAIARGFTDAMGGRISLEETPGGGLMVSITLPAATAQTAGQTAAALSP
ncbi:MAG: osmosensitive channel signal transduction histidine kinase, partial [Frankiales bacterium]|nr:osmosensitive channel signal transduction histidine kinase [Frankiales bacterium]